MWKSHPGPYESTFTFSDALQIYQAWGFWLWLAVMGLGQALLLLVPVGLAEGRPTARRPLFVPVITTSFFLANLFLGGLVSVLCAILGDNALELFERLGGLAQADAERNPITSQVWSRAAATTGPSTAGFIFGVAMAVAVFWLVWAVIFYRFARSDDPASLVKRGTRWLLRSSILDLLVAVPSHIIVRHRHDCCAPAGTLYGMATGIAVMLLCFGPGVFFLFVERFARLKPQGLPKATEPAPPVNPKP